MKNFKKDLDVVQAIALEILEIDASENRNGLCTIITEGSNANSSGDNGEGIWQCSYKMLQRLAKKAGVASPEMLESAFNTNDIGDTFLHMNVRWVDQSIEIGLDENGDPILNKDGGTNFRKEHFRREGNFTSIELSPEVVEYVAEINKQADLQDVLAMRETSRSKRTKRTARKAVKTVETIDLDDLDASNDVDEEEVDDLFNAEEEEPAPEEKKTTKKRTTRSRTKK